MWNLFFLICSCVMALLLYWDYSKKNWTKCFFLIFYILFIIHLAQQKGERSEKKDYLKYDYTLYQHIQATNKIIKQFYQNHNSLPETLQEIKDKTQINKFDVTYHAISPSSYKICALFYKDYSYEVLKYTLDGFKDKEYEKELYKKGHHCFEVKL